MANNAMNAFGMVLDNSSALEKEVRTNIIGLLGINSKDENLTEYIQECVSHFNVNNIEHNYIESIRKVIDEELSKIQQQKKENGSVDYSLISESLANRLRQLQNQDFSLDDDLKDLAIQIPNKFPLCGITQEQFLSHFNSKKEAIMQMIKSYNNSITDTLIKLSPQLMEEFKQLENQNTNNVIDPTPDSPTRPSSPKTPSSPTSAAIPLEVSNQNKEKNDIHMMVTNANSLFELLNVKATIEKLKASNPNNEQIDIELMNVINKIVNITAGERKNINQPDGPAPLNSSAEIGNSNESMRQLIDSGSYFSVLQGISNNNINKYRAFINDGFRVIFSRWKVAAENTKNNEQRRASFEQLKEIYENFKDYLQSEQDTINMLETTISEMTNYFMAIQAREQKKQQVSTIPDGIRYNSSNSDLNRSARRM